MIIAKTPWLHMDEDGCMQSYVYKDVFFACTHIVDQYFDIPKGSKIRFVVYNRPGNYRYSAHTKRAVNPRCFLLYINGEEHGGLFTGLEAFLRKFDIDKTYYVECEIK